jgi:NitT/TauT family transport system ATP-binding protein
MDGISAKNLCKSFDGTPVIKNLSFSFDKGSVNLILGASGIGKTTLIRILAGLDTADSGELLGIVSDRISFLFQEDRLFPWLNAEENVKAVIKNKESYPLARKLLSELSLDDAIKKFPSELSGGMMRRVAIARALASDGDILILDEPLQGLDSETKKQTVNVIKKYSEGKTVIIVTHSPSEFDGFATNCLSL